MTYRDLEPKRAKALLDSGEGWVYVDVRTPEEFEAGHPAGAYNVPIAVLDASGRLAPNREFVPVMRKRFPPGSKLLLGCAVGGRSRHACEQLLTEGWRDLVNVDGGYSGARDGAGRVVVPGWLAAGLPIETACGPEHAWEALRRKAAGAESAR
jgi:rhodanese-related sulfurtransferase